MNTPIFQDLDRRAERKREQESKSKPGHLFFVDYIGHRAAVTLKGAGFLDHVRFDDSIKIGTEDAPLVWRGNACEVRKVGKKYVVTAVANKTECIFPPAVVDITGDGDFGTVDPDNEDQFQLPELDSFTTSSFPSLVIPTNTFESPTFKGAAFSPEGFGTPGVPLFLAGGYNGSIASGVTLEDLFHAADYATTLQTISLYCPDADVTFLIDIDGVNVIEAARVAGDWTVQGSGAGSADSVTHFALPTPVLIVPGSLFRSAIQADGAVTVFGWGAMGV